MSGRMRVCISGVLCFLAVFGAMAAPDFGSRTQVGTVAYVEIDEASGLAVSRNNPHIIWVANDSGPNAVYAVTTNGTCVGMYYIDGFAMRDWEDIAIGPGPIAGVDYLYIGNIGDNNSAYATIFVARIPEPAVDPGQAFVTSTLYGAGIFTLQYSSGAIDSETLMVDPWTKNIHIVTKRDGTSSDVNLHTAAYPQSTSGTTTMAAEGSVNLSYAVGGDIAPSGEQILIKQSWQDDTFLFNTLYPERIYHWARGTGQTIRQALDGARTQVPYSANSSDQCEAVAWKHNDAGYYTISEGASQPLYFYDNLDLGEFHWLDTEAGINGSVSPSDQWVAQGSSVDVTATSDAYYHFSVWTGDTQGDAGNSVMTLVMNAPATVQGNFIENLAPEGTPEWWMVLHGLTNGTFAEEELADGDNDGRLAWQEWVCDTDPTNGASVLQITDIEPDGAGMKVYWKGGVQSTQVLEWRTNLVSGTDWMPVHTNLPPTPVISDFTDPMVTNPAGFYRIKVER